MRFVLTMRGETPISLPLAYNHSVQSLIYSAVSDNNGFSELHNVGWTLGEKVFRLFTFGPLSGEYTVADGHITFISDIFLEIRSCDDAFMRSLSACLYPGGKVKLDIYRLTVVSGQLCINASPTERWRIRMLSPMVAYRTQPDRKTLYLSPEDSDFGANIDQNFRAKYKAFTGAAPNSGVGLCPCRVKPSDKVVTRYKGFYITGWRGVYELSGEAEHLSFLYCTGLGGKNAQGFGMFEPL